MVSYIAIQKVRQNLAFSTVFISEDTSTMPAMSNIPHPEMPPIQTNINGIIQFLQTI